jgi:hypothetical protein
VRRVYRQVALRSVLPRWWSEKWLCTSYEHWQRLQTRLQLNHDLVAIGQEDRDKRALLGDLVQEFLHWTKEIARFSCRSW